MLTVIEGNLFESKAEALVNTVNTVGVMGKGIALQFKETFPKNNEAYIDACKRKELAPGKLLAVWDTNLLLGRRLIINFPTKTHWRYPSKYEYIDSGLKALIDLLQKENIRSVALPPLGCGNGGLEWSKVKSLMIHYLGGLAIEIEIFQPDSEIKALLEREKVKKRLN